MSDFAQLFAATCTDSATAARLNRHDLHPWVRKEGFSARTACRRCGATLEVKVTATTNATTGSALTRLCLS